MTIAILGCGGVGGYYGGKFARFYSTDPSTEIIFIARGRHLEAIRAHGLKINSPGDVFVVQPSVATTSPENSGVFDLLLVAVKTYDMEHALAQVKTNIGARTVIIPLVNGVEGYELLQEQFPFAKIFQGCCYLNSFVEAPGVIRFRGGFEQVQIGFADEALLNTISNVLTAAGIDVYAAKDSSGKTWEKFIFGSVLSGIGSLENESFGEIAASPQRMLLARNLMNELFAIAAAKGIGLRVTVVEELLVKIATFPYDARTSMQLDFSNGKQTEIETFIGYVVRCADELNIDAPAYKSLYNALLK